MNIKNLGEVAQITMGSAPPGKSYNEVGNGIPMIAGAGDYGEKYPKPKKWTTSPSRITEIGDLIVCVRATIGDLNWADKKYCLGRGVAGLRAKKGKLDINFAAHYINAKKIDLTKLGTGSTFLAIRRADLENFPIPLPPLAEQKRIAAILNKSDSMRRKRHQAIQLAYEFLRSVFLDMFGDPENNPKGWPKIPLRELIVDGPQNGLYRPSQDYGSGTQILRIDSFYDGKIRNLHTLKRVRIDNQTINKYKLHVNDIVINRVNSRKYLGKSALAEKLSETTVYESNMMRFSVNENLIIPKYLVDLLQKRYIRNQILNLSRDAVNQSSINQSDVKSLMILLPPIENQIKYIQIVKLVENNIAMQHNSSSYYMNFFKSLSQRAFRGEL